MDGFQTAVAILNGTQRLQMTAGSLVITWENGRFWTMIINIDKKSVAIDRKPLQIACFYYVTSDVVGFDIRQWRWFTVWCSNLVMTTEQYVMLYI